ncbi:MAG: hypothetical protein ABIH26_12760 [Candidatus Eisenbacteria bacterium]
MDVVGRWWFEILIGLWFAGIYVERLLVDLRLWSDADPGWRGAASHPAVWLFTIVAAPLCILGLAAPGEWAGVLSDWLAGALWGLLRGLPWTILVLAVLLAAFVVWGMWKAIGTRKTVLRVLDEETRNVSRKARGMLGDRARAVLLVGLAALLFWLLSLVPVPDEDLRNVYRGWLLGWLFIAALGIVYGLVYRRAFGRVVRAHGREQSFWRGWGKDVLIYTIAGAALGGGLRRWALWVEAGNTKLAWVALGIFLFFTTAFAVPALVLEFLYMSRQRPGDRIMVDYPKDWQREIVATHTYLRDLGLFIPWILVQFLWAGLKVVYATAG